MNKDSVDFSALNYKKYSEVVSFSRYKMQYTFSAIIVVLVWYVVRDWPAYIVTAVVISYFSGKYREYKRKQWILFAEQNGWKVGSVQEADIPPSLRGVGRTSSIGGQHLIDGSYEAYRFRAFDYRYTVGSGRSSHTYTVTVMRLLYEKELPHFILDSKKNSGGAQVTPQDFETIGLEGDFNDYFQLFARKSDRIDVLSFVTPDLMQTMIRANQTQDVEAYGGSVFFISVGDMRSTSQLPDLFSSAHQLNIEIAHKLSSYRPLDTTVRVAQSTYNQKVATKSIGSDSRAAKIILIVIIIAPIVITALLIAYIALNVSF